MRIILLLVIVPLLSGCFVVVKDGDKTKIFGENKEIARDTLQKIGLSDSEESVMKESAPAVPAAQDEAREFLK